MQSAPVSSNGNTYSSAKSVCATCLFLYIRSLKSALDRHGCCGGTKLTHHPTRRLRLLFSTSCGKRHLALFALSIGGRVYVETQRAFGDFSSFLAACTCWMSNLPYFPAVLHFGAGDLLFAFPQGQQYAHKGRDYFVFALVCLAVITLLYVLGLRFGKWFSSLRALGSWLQECDFLVNYFFAFGGCERVHLQAEKSRIPGAQFRGARRSAKHNNRL